MSLPDQTNDEYLVLWVIYYDPSDYRGLFVARKHYFHDGAESIDKHCVVSNSLSAIRAHIPKGLIRFDRDPKDDPCILEIWL